jgi:hypothetical protein
MSVLSTVTQSNYKANYDRIVKALGPTFTAPEAIKYLTTKYSNPGTRNTYYSALKFYATQEDKLLYLAETKKDIPAMEAQQTAQILPPQKEENILKWEQIQQAFEDATKLYNEGKISLQQLLIVGLYSLTDPVRLDYVNMEFATHSASKWLPHPTTKLTAENPAYKYLLEESKTNYCWLGEQPRFIFNSYKTSGKYHQVMLDIPEKLVKLLRLYADEDTDLRPNNPVLYKGTANGFGKALGRIFYDLTGKCCTVNLIRHSRVDYFYRTNTNPSIKAKQELARKMLHSHTIQEKYRTET